VPVKTTQPPLLRPLPAHHCRLLQQHLRCGAGVSLSRSEVACWGCCCHPHLRAGRVPLLLGSPPPWGRGLLLMRLQTLEQRAPGLQLSLLRQLNQSAALHLLLVLLALLTVVKGLLLCSQWLQSGCVLGACWVRQPPLPPARCCSLLPSCCSGGASLCLAVTPAPAVGTLFPPLLPWLPL
jgi:hypothetical protein